MACSRGYIIYTYSCREADCVWSDSGAGVECLYWACHEYVLDLVLVSCLISLIGLGLISLRFSTFLIFLLLWLLLGGPRYACISLYIGMGYFLGFYLNVFRLGYVKRNIWSGIFGRYSNLSLKISK